MVLALVTALLVPAAAMAQLQAQVFRMGVLALYPPGPPRDAHDAVLSQLQNLGYIVGKNLVVEMRHANFQAERLPELAEELVRAKVDVILAVANLPGFAAKNASTTIPIVVWGMHGAVESGLVRSLARPGGNVTGVESLAPELDAKRLEVLKEIVPGLARLGVLYNADDQVSQVHLASARAASRALGVTLLSLPVRRPADFDAALSGAGNERIDGLLMFTDPLTGRHWRKVAEFALKNRLPTVCEFRFLAQFGCLVSYGPPFEELHERAAMQVDRILKGARPSDLPVEQITRFE
ncbi:MAG: ABC transporter substrate-binding protein, partial [Burkholderiaceae bacterium]